jgi:hypothetical protein
VAGNYPDPLSWRMRYDADGSEILWLADGSSSPAAISNANARSMNDESSGSQPSYGTNGRVVIIFPELRDLDGYFADIGGYAYSYRYPQTLETSVDTTNGYDGTWVSQGNWQSQSTVPGWRSNIVGLTVLGIRAVRFRETAGGAITSTTWATLHLYGEPTNPDGDRLEFWHPTLDQKLGPAALEYGDRQRNSTTLKEFRVKNLSDDQRALGVRVAMEALTDANPSLVGQHGLSLDATTFLSQVTIGDLEPGEISGIVTQRQQLTSSAQLSIWNFWTFTEATSWEAAV